MTPKTRQEAIAILQKISKGQLKRVELYADYTISTFLDLMKISSIPDTELAGKAIAFKEPMLSYLAQFDE